MVGESGAGKSVTGLAVMGRNLAPVLLCPSPLRRTLRGLLHRSMPYIAVLGLNEIPPTLSVRSFAAIQGT